ncbi:MAG: CPBP family intramembrane glutamic endopeptidase [Brevefilum sp.]
MINKTDKKRITLFLAFAFGISWATALVIFITGGLENSPSFDVGGIQISLAYILLATVFMFGPAIANVLTRVLTREGKSNLLLKPLFDQRRWIYYLSAWVLPGLLIILGMVAFFVLFPGYFDRDLSMLTEQLQAVDSTSNISPWLIIIVQTLQAILIAPILNAVSTFGEEFGWRGYLQPKLMPIGGRKAVLLTGVIWGIWHWPVILMGHNYGTDYFGAPFLGPLAMVWFTLTLSVIMGWLTIKANSVWPAVITHGALNGIAGLGILLVKGSPSTLLGPTPVGVIGGLGLTLAAALILFQPGALSPQQSKPLEISES